MAKKIKLYRVNDNYAEYGGDSRETLTTPQNTALHFDRNADPQASDYGDIRNAMLTHGNRNVSYTEFELLPAGSVTASTDKLFTVSGTGTEVIARDGGGGVNLKSQATTPADGDEVLLAAVANTGVHVPITATSLPYFSTIVDINDITACFFSVGLSENVTDSDPTGTAGEGALFLFDPTEEVTTGLTTAQHANWILAHKVNGVDTFTATDIAVAADTDYKLEIILDSDLKANFYIDDVFVGQGPALTSGDTVKAFSGIELTATPGGQKDVAIRRVMVSRVIG